MVFLPPFKVAHNSVNDFQTLPNQHLCQKNQSEGWLQNTVSHNGNVMVQYGTPIIAWHDARTTVLQ